MPNWWQQVGNTVKDILERNRPTPQSARQVHGHQRRPYPETRNLPQPRPTQRYGGVTTPFWTQRAGYAAPRQVEEARRFFAMRQAQPPPYARGRRPGPAIERAALGRALAPAERWYREAAGRIGTAGAGEYTPIRAPVTPRAATPAMAQAARAISHGRGAPVPRVALTPGATVADVAENMKQMRILGSPLPGRSWAALAEAGRTVGGGALQALATPAQEMERAIGGAAVGLEAARQAGAQGLPLPEQARVAGAGFQLGRQALGPVTYSVAGEQLAQGARAIGTPESGTLAPLTQTPAPAGIERARRALELAAQGASPEEIAAEVGSPIAEAAGQVLLDPLNFIGVGATARRQAGEAATARKYFTEADPRSYDEIRNALRSGGNPRPSAGPIESIANVINPRTQAGRAELLIEDTGDVVTIMSQTAETPEARLDVIRNLINIGDPDQATAAAARQALADFGSIPESQAGKQATVFLREIATDEATGKVDPGVIGRTIRKAETPEQATEALVRRLENAADNFYKVRRSAQGGVSGTGFLVKNPVKSFQNGINGVLARWFHLGMSPSYAHRNLATNILHNAVDGTLSFASADAMADWGARFGFRTKAATRAIGGVSGMKAGETIEGARRFRPITMKEAYSTLLKKESWKEGPALALGQAFEQYTSERVWYKATRQMWDRTWQYGRAIPSNPVIDALPRDVRNYVLGRVSGAMDTRELQSIITDLRKRKAIEAWRVPDNSLTASLQQINPDLADEVARAGRDAADPDDFARRLDDILSQTDDHTAQALADDTPLITQADPAADDVTIISNTEGPHAATETGQRIAAGRQQRDAARVMAWTRLEDIPEQARNVAQQVGDWVGQQIVETYRAADEATAQWMRREISFDEAEAIKRQLWDTFTRQRDAQYAQVIQQLGPDARPLLVLRQADDASIAQAAMTKQKAAAVWSRYRAGEIPYDAAKAEVEQLWNLHNRYATTQYDQAWRALGGDPARGPLARIGVEPIQRSPAVLRRELAASALDAGIPGIRIKADGSIAPHPRLLNTINKDLEAAGLQRVKRLGDMDAQQLEAATAGMRRRAAGEAVPEAAKAAPVVEAPPPAEPAAQTIGPTKARALDLDEYATASGLDPARMNPNDWQLLAQNARSEGQRLIQRGDELARGVGVSMQRGAVTEMEAFGTTIRGRQGGISARQAQELERSLSKEARAAALEDMGNILQSAGFSEEELTGLNFQQRRRILEEMGQGDLLTTKRGKPATIDAIDPERRTELIQGTRPDIARLAGATATEPTTGRGYTLIEWADEAQRRADAVRWAQSLDPEQRARELEGLRTYRATLDDVMKEATGEELIQLQDEMREIDARLWALEPPEPRAIQPRPARPQPAPEIPQPEPPQRVVSEIAQSLDDAPPTRATLSAEASARAEPILRQIRDGIAAAPVEPGTLDPRTLQQLENWLKGLTPRMNEAKAIAARVGGMERDFTLLNYADRRLSDTMMSYVMMYGFWPSRTVPNWARRIANNPALIARYMRYKQAQHELNKDLPEWWREQISVNPFGLLENPLYMNIEQTLNPLYQVVNDFEDRDRGGPGRPFGQAMQAVGNVGFGSVWMPLQMTYALALAQRGDTEGAQAWTSYLGTPTRTLRYASSLLREAGAPGIPAGGIVLEPWLWQGGYFQGGDKWERRRIGKALYDLHREGTITYEQMVDAAYSQTGDIWDQAMQRATVQRAPGAVGGYLLGQGFKTRYAYEIDIDRASDEWYNLMAGKEGMNPDQFAAARDEFLSRYPWMPAIWMSKKGDAERDTSMAWDAINRLPPGDAKAEMLTAAKMDQDLLDRFYQDGGDMSAWTRQDRDRFMAAVLDIAATVQVPDTLTVKEWKKVKALNQSIYKEAEKKWPGIDEVQDEYFRTQAQQGDEAATAYLESHPELREYWSYKNERLTSDALLFSYYGEQSDLERRALNDLYAEAESRWPGVQQAQTQYFQLKDAGGDYQTYLNQHPELREYWDFMRIGKQFIKQFPPPAPGERAARPATLRPEQPVSPTQEAIAATAAPPTPTAPAIEAARPPGVAAPAPAAQAQTIGQLNWQQPTAPATTLPRAPQQLEQWRDLIQTNAQATGIDPRIIATVIYIESTGDPNATGAAGDTGLMQVMPKEAGGVFVDRPTTEQLRDPSFNVQYGTQILKDYIDYFDGDVRKGLAAYNTGRGYVSKEGVQGAKAQRYLKLFDDAYAKLWGGEAPAQGPAAQLPTLPEGPPAPTGPTAQPGTYAAQMFQAAGDTLTWTYQNGTQEELTQQLTSAMYDEAERRFPGAREASAEYGKLTDRGASKEEKKAFREAHPGLTDYWDYTSARRDFIKENELQPGGTPEELASYLDRLLGGTGGAGLTGPIALEKARQYSESGDFHLGPRKRRYEYRLTNAAWEKMPEWVRSAMGQKPYATPLYGEGGRRGGGGGGGRRGGGGYKRKVSSYTLRQMSPALLAQLRDYFAGGQLEEGALRELAALGIGDPETLRSFFVTPVPHPMPRGKSGSRSRPTFWRAF